MKNAPARSQCCTLARSQCCTPKRVIFIQNVSGGGGLTSSLMRSKGDKDEWRVNLLVDSGALLFVLLHVLCLTLLLLNCVAHLKQRFLLKLVQEGMEWAKSSEEWTHILTPVMKMEKYLLVDRVALLLVDSVANLKGPFLIHIIFCIARFGDQQNAVVNMWIEEETCSLTVLHCSSLTVEHCCSWTVLHT